MNRQNLQNILKMTVGIWEIFTLHLVLAPTPLPANAENDPEKVHGVSF
jgi:hypothetical protein